jgi:hypothetical protein
MKLSLQMLLRKEITTLVNSFQKAGRYDVSFSAIGGSAYAMLLNY